MNGQWKREGGDTHAGKNLAIEKTRRKGEKRRKSQRGELREEGDKGGVEREQG